MQLLPARLTDRGVVADLLRRHGLAADRAFGQNFVVDPGVVGSVVAAAELDTADTVFEVGPGLGTLTRALADAAGGVVAVELDRRLLPVLAETVGDLPNVTVVPGDGLRYDLTSLPHASVLAANLPYNVATAVVSRCLASGRFARVACLVQLEVARRLVAGPGDSDFGALSLLVAHHGRARIVRTVPPGAFLPEPKVRSAVVAIAVDPTAEPAPELFALVRTAFAHRRKTLKRNLLMAGYDREAVVAAVGALGLGADVRAERLSLADLGALLAALGPVPSHA